MNKVVAIVGLLACAVASVTAGCGSSHSSGFGDDPDASVFGAADDASFGEGGTGVQQCTGPHCSSDLHNLIDCNGQVLMTCPADQGCAGTSCVAACDSAKDNKSNIGCDYYSVDPDVILDGAGACFAAFVANTWTTPVTMTVDYGGQSLDISKFAYVPHGTGANIQYAPLVNGQIPPGQVAVFFLNRHPGFPSPLHLDCPVGITPAITAEDTALHGTGIGKAFHITSSAPVVAYDIFPYGGGGSAMTSATLLLPTSAWDTNYVAVDAYGSGPVSQPFVEIVAQENDTQVTINPTAAIVGGSGVAPGPKGQPTSYKLDKGQVLQFTQDAPLAGSIIQTTKPVGVWGGKSSLGIDSCCDDTGHQQIPPVRALGSEYVGVRYRNRYDGQEEAPPWRFVGAANGTVLTYEPSAPAGAPKSLALGQVAQFNAAGPFVVKSQDGQHPFYMSAHMTGAGAFDPGSDGMSPADGRGDPEFVNVIPPGEFLQSYVFFADPTYSETNLVLVRAKVHGSFADVSLDCAGTLGGWAPIGTKGDYEFTRLDLVRHNFAPQGKCDNGRHEIHSDKPFGLTVWGWGSAETGDTGRGFNTQYVSYAYPAGAGVAPINTVVVPPTVK
jgi:IgGFc binding protein